MRIQERQQKKSRILIEQTRTKVIPQKAYHKILYLYPAINGTFVFLGMLGLRQDCVTHMDKKGNVLFQHVFQKPMDAFGMLSQDEAIMIQTRGNSIVLLDLKKHQFRRVSHHFFNEQSDQSVIHTFAESKLLCIQEDGRYNDNRFKLSYYEYPMTSDSKPFNIYQAKDNQWTFQYQVKKANQHSMIAWFKPRHDQQWEFRTYDVRDIKKGKYNVYKFPQQIGIPYNMSKVEVALLNIWQTAKDQFMLVCITNKTDEHKNAQLGIVQNNYICDTTSGNIRQAQFSFGWHHDYLIDYYNMGRYCMFRTFQFENGKPLPSPVFYLENEAQQIIAMQKWQCSYLYKFEFPGYDQDMMIQNLFENGDCQWFECCTKKFFVPKQLSLHMLLSLNENFDEDLLQETLEILEDEEQPSIIKKRNQINE